MFGVKWSGSSAYAFRMNLSGNMIENQVAERTVKEKSMPFNAHAYDANQDSVYVCV